MELQEWQASARPEIFQDAISPLRWWWGSETRSTSVLATAEIRLVLLLPVFLVVFPVNLWIIAFKATIHLLFTRRWPTKEEWFAYHRAGY